GRQLSPEGRGRLHPHSGAAGALACSAEIARSEDECRKRGNRRERQHKVRGRKVWSEQMKMWSGRFSQELNADFEQWQRSFPFDRILLPYEVAASKAHAAALAKASVLSA